MAETLPTDDADNPEQLVIDQENVRLFLERARDSLSPMERVVLDESLAGLNYLQIARSLEKVRSLSIMRYRALRQKFVRCKADHCM